MDRTHPRSVTTRPHMLVADAEEGTRESLRLLFGHSYQVAGVADGDAALARLRRGPVDCAVVDLALEGLPGERLFESLRRVEPGLPVVTLTAHPSLESATRALRCGVADYLAKPFDVVQLNASVCRALDCRPEPRPARQPAGEAWLREFLEALVELTEEADGGSAGHGRRCGAYASLLARRLGLGPQECEQVRTAAGLHDLGRLGLRPELRLHPGPLLPADRAEARRHVLLGDRLLEPLALPEALRRAIRHHHEWWDGSGYPDGLAEQAIPLEARLLAIADAYDAMTSDRPWRPAPGEAHARAELERGAGVQFDPVLVKEFLSLLETEDLEAERVAASVCGPETTRTSSVSAGASTLRERGTR